MTTLDRNSEVAVLEAMGGHFVPPPEYGEATAAVAEIVTHVAVRRDGDTPWGEGNRAKCRAVLVHGLARTGKTELAQQLAGDLPDLVSVDGKAIVQHPLLVECPSAFDQTLLYNLIIHELLDGNSKRSLPSTAAYLRIEQQLPVHRPTLLVLDEFQYAALPRIASAARQESVAKALFGFLRHLLDHPAWPVPLVLVGLPEIETVLNQPEQKFLDEKITRIRIAPMMQGSLDEFDLLSAALTAYCEDAGIENSIGDDDLFKRLIHATDHARGLALELCQTSVMRAWRDGRRALQIADFAARYRISTQASDDENPFIVHGWQNTDRSRLAKDSQQDEIAKTRKRKS